MGLDIGFDLFDHVIMWSTWDRTWNWQLYRIIIIKVDINMFIKWANLNFYTLYESDPNNIICIEQTGYLKEILVYSSMTNLASEICSEYQEYLWKGIGMANWQPSLPWGWLYDVLSGIEQWSLQPKKNREILSLKLWLHANPGPTQPIWGGH